MCVCVGGGGVQNLSQIYQQLNLSYMGLFKDMIFSWQVDEIFYLLAFALLVYTEL